MSGAWTMGAAAVGGASSLIGAGKNAKAASNAMNAQQAAQQQQLDFQRQQYNRYLGLYGPIEEQLAAQAKSSEPLFYDQNKAQIQQQYSNAIRNQAAQMGMRGMAGSGVDMGMGRAAALGQAGALSNAYSQGLQNRMNLGLSLTGRGQIGQAAGGVAQGMQGMANLYGGQANLYNQGAAQGWSNFGNAINSGLGMYGNMQMQQQYINALNGINNPSAWATTPLPQSESLSPLTMGQAPTDFSFVPGSV